MDNENNLAQNTDPHTVPFERPIGIRKRKLSMDEYMRKYYIHDMYCPSNENRREIDPVGRAR
jgi:hypothetical protein